MSLGPHPTNSATPAPPVPTRVDLGDEPVVVHGATLGGLAVAARLAKQGHVVVLDAHGQRDGGHWAPREVQEVLVDDLPQTFLLPAAWRDLFKKSGRAMDAELTRHGLTLEPAPAQEHRFADGRTLVLPAERGDQFHAVEDAFGRGAAERWRDVLDELDEVWQQLRLTGLERRFEAAALDARAKQKLLAGLTLEGLAERVQDAHLGTIIRSQASLAGAPPGRAPALLAVRLAVHRRFGSWQLLREGAPERASAVVDLLTERAGLRGVQRTSHSGPTSATVEARPQRPAGWLARRSCPPALAPQVRQRIVEATSEGIVERLDHRAGNPVVTWHRPLPDGRAVETVHDHRTVRPDLAWGLAPASFRAWRSRPGIRADEGWNASCAQHAGNEPWAELLTAALVAYEVHEERTGEDIRPTNKTQPTPRRQARPALS